MQSRQWPQRSLGNLFRGHGRFLSLLYPWLPGCLPFVRNHCSPLRRRIDFIRCNLSSNKPVSKFLFQKRKLRSSKSWPNSSMDTALDIPLVYWQQLPGRSHYTLEMAHQVFPGKTVDTQILHRCISTWDFCYSLTYFQSSVYCAWIIECY